MLKRLDEFEILDYREEKLDGDFFKSLKDKINKLVNSGATYIILVFRPGNYPIPDWFIDWIKRMRSKGVYIIIVISYQYNNLCCVSKPLFSQIDIDFREYLCNHGKYTSKLVQLSLDLGLGAWFCNVSPTYWTGNYCDNQDKYVLISLNPGLKPANIYVEEIIKNFTFYTSGGYNPNDWLNFYRNFYKLFFLNGLSSKYYTDMGKFFEGLHKDSDKDEKGWNKQGIYKFYDNHLINMDIIPYHSKGISLNLKNFSHKGLCYIANRFRDILDFIKCLKQKQKVRKIILNGNIFVDLLVKREVEKYSNLYISKNPLLHKKYGYKYRGKNKEINIYWVKVNSICMVVIDKFLEIGRSGLTNKDLYEIGSLIRSNSPPGC